MLIYTARRLVSSVLVLLVTSFVVFVFAAANYDPLKPFRARNPMPPHAFFVEKAKEYHLDEPVLTRYWHWLVHMVGIGKRFPYLQFDFGNDVNGGSVATSIGQRLAVTTRMIVGAIIVAALLAIVLGVVSGVRHDKAFDVVVTLFTFVLLALPTFWFAALLKESAIQVNHGLDRQLFYTVGTESFGEPQPSSFFAMTRDQFLHMILPVLSLGLLTASGWIRYVRASTMDVIEADYMRLARAKGVRYRTVIRRHGLRNALIPFLTIAAITVGSLFGGAIITEQVYDWHGMGEYLNTAITAEDTYGVAGWVMVSAIFVVLFNLVADLLYAVVDPRIRLE